MLSFVVEQWMNDEMKKNMKLNSLNKWKNREKFDLNKNTWNLYANVYVSKTTSLDSWI